MADGIDFEQLENALKDALKRDGGAPKDGEKDISQRQILSAKRKKRKQKKSPSEECKDIKKEVNVTSQSPNDNVSAASTISSAKVPPSCSGDTKPDEAHTKTDLVKKAKAPKKKKSCSDQNQPNVADKPKSGTTAKSSSDQPNAADKPKSGATAKSSSDQPHVADKPKSGTTAKSSTDHNQPNVADKPKSGTTAKSSSDQPNVADKPKSGTKTKTSSDSKSKKDQVDCKENSELVLDANKKVEGGQNGNMTKKKPGSGTNNNKSRPETSDTKSGSQSTAGQSTKEDGSTKVLTKMKEGNTNNNKPKPRKLGDEGITEELLQDLVENKMHVLKKPNPKFRNARFYCRLCDYHIDLKEDCLKHMKDNRHCRRKEISAVDAILRLLPDPSAAQIQAMTLAVDDIWKAKAITSSQQEIRRKIVERLDNILKQHIPDVLVFMYGSSLTGFGLSTADINVDLSSAKKSCKLTHLLQEVHTTMKDKADTGFHHVRADFSAKVPLLLLTDEETGLVVSLAIHCYAALCSSKLLAIYSQMDVRVQKLIVAFRYWANLCGLDRQSDGFIPPQALNIMVIYFLQALNPQLIPIIFPPKVSSEDVGDFRLDEPAFEKMRAKAMKCCSETRNSMSIGELWLRLLKFYCLEFDVSATVVSIRSSQPITRNVKPWNCKKLAVEDPYMTKKNITRMVNNARIFEYWQDSIRKAYYYFGLPRNSEGKSMISEEELKANAASADSSPETSAVTKPKPSTSKVTSESKEAEGIEPNPLISTKSKDEPEKISENSKEIDSEPIPSPIASKDCNGTDSVSIPSPIASKDCNDTKGSSSVFQTPTSLADSGFIDSSQSRTPGSVNLIDTPISAGSTPVLDGELLNKTVPLTPFCLSKSCDTPVDSNASDSGEPEENLSDFARTYATDIITKAVSTISLSSSQTDNKDGDNPISDSHEATEPVDAEDNETLPTKADESCLYDFDKNYFTDGKGPALLCLYCDKEGHLKNACPEDSLPEVLNLPDMTDHHLKVLSETLNLVPFEVGLSDSSIRGREHFLFALQDFIQYMFDDAELALFGSTYNGFGFDKSDMDICMTFTRRKKIDKIHIIETLARRLKTFPELYNVQAITTAKVPIVKFCVRRNQLEGDISLYNTLAQQNTKLLRCYSQIDPRVRTLGYAIKTFAKVCDIGDASRGSLSSYAYILMMLYYLQQVQPPVIPVLQELHEGGEKPKLIIEDCEAWFMEDLHKLGKLWPEKGKNKQSVAELWLGFLRFYVEEFNYKEYVVSIRQKALLTRFEKLWNGTCIAVEDPFDVAHNLGSGLTRKMNNFIFKTFINGRMLYGSPIDSNMDIFNTYQCASDYFFDTELLSENRPPNVRGCRRCGKIGHLVKACPLNRKDREEEEIKQRQLQQQRQMQQQRQQDPRYQQQPRHQYQAQQKQRQPQQAPRQQYQQQQQQQQQQQKPQRHQQNPQQTNSQNMSTPQQNQRQQQQQFRQGDLSDRSDSGSSKHGQGSNGGNTNRNSSAGGQHMQNQSSGHMNRSAGPQTQQQHLMSLTFQNSSYQQQSRHGPHQQQFNQNQPSFHHSQHQQHQQYHHQQANRPPPPPGFNMQPMMASTPVSNMNMPMHYQGPYHQPQHQHYSGNMRGSAPGRQQQRYHGNDNPNMNPIVQNLFSSAQGQVLNMKKGGGGPANKYH